MPQVDRCRNNRGKKYICRKRILKELSSHQCFYLQPYVCTFLDIPSRFRFLFYREHNFLSVVNTHCISFVSYFPFYDIVTRVSSSVLTLSFSSFCCLYRLVLLLLVYIVYHSYFINRYQFPMVEVINKCTYSPVG